VIDVIKIDSLAYRRFCPRFAQQKCDEIRVENSCKTCIRLNIDCLGWGVKRPEWMRVSFSFFLLGLGYRQLIPSHLVYVGQAASPGIPRQNHGQAPSRKQDSGPAPPVLRPGSNPIRSQYSVLQPRPHSHRLTTQTKILRQRPLTVLKH